MRDTPDVGASLRWTEAAPDGSPAPDRQASSGIAPRIRRMRTMSEGDASPSSAETDYQKLAGEVRSLIASGAFHTPAAIEDLQQLAACYEARAKHEESRGQANGATGPGPPGHDETLKNP